jgi:hypothetical protein
MTLTIQIEEKLQKSLEKMASENGKQVGQFVIDIIDDYMGRGVTESRELKLLMKLSETSFNEWNNEEDAIYDSL